MKPKDHYLLLLHLALRDLKSRTEVSFAVRVADTFHNVPGALVFDWTESRESRIRAQIESKGAVHHISSQLDAWESEADSALMEQEYSGILPDSALAPRGRFHRAFFLKFLELALVEIRFLQHEPQHPGFAARVADLMHSVTGALLSLRHWDERVGESFYRRLIARAKSYELESFIERLAGSVQCARVN